MPLTGKNSITLTVNGTKVSREVEARTHLIDFLRDEVGLTGSHIGCEHGVCGACTIRVDGKIVRGCLTLALRCGLDEGHQRFPSPASSL